MPTTAGLDIAQLHALNILAADIDAFRRCLDATIEAVRWESTSALMLRRLTMDLSADMRSASYALARLAL